MNTLIVLSILSAVAVSGLFVSTAYAQALPGVCLECPPPTITSPTHNSVIDSHTFTITGTSVAGYLVTVLDERKLPLGSTIAQDDGSWSVEVTLRDGTYSLTAAAFPDPQNLVAFGTSQDQLWVTVRGGDPNIGEALRMSITSHTLGQVLSGSEHTLSGTAPPFNFIQIFDISQTVIARTSSDASGNWAATVNLDNGMHVFLATASDGTSFIHSNQLLLYVRDSTPGDPLSPKVTFPRSGHTFDTHTVTLAGTAEPGASIFVFDAVGALVAPSLPGPFVIADENGDWSLQFREAASGTHFYTILSQKAGVLRYSTPIIINVASASQALPGQLALPTIMYPQNGDIVPSGPSVTMRGTAAPNSLVLVQDYTSILGGTISDAAGDWSLTHHLDDGVHILVATYITQDGRTSGHAPMQIFHVDSGTTIQERPTIAPTTTIRGNTIQMSGTAAPGTLVDIVSFETPIATVRADGTGAWSYTEDLSDGLYILSAVSYSTDRTQRSDYAMTSIYTIPEFDASPLVRVCR